MELQELVRNISNFADTSHTEKVKLFGWYLHVHCRSERFDQAAIRECYDKLHYTRPANVSECFRQLQERRPPELLKDRLGYRLEGRVRASLDQKYGSRPVTIEVDSMLADLPGKISDVAERIFLDEAVSCYRAQAYRAAIVMTWNLAYDHLLNWIMAEPSRLATFNARIGIRFSKKTNVVISRREDFEELKESEVIQICNSASLFSKNINRILEEKLTRRNMAAHPSLVEIVRYQADDTISDLVHNVILTLT